MRRDNPREMALKMQEIYRSSLGRGARTICESALPAKSEIVKSAHDIVRLGLSIIAKYEELQKKNIELSIENSKFKKRQKDNLSLVVSQFEG